MCLISREIESVSNTKILVAPNQNNTRQLTVYSNQVLNVSDSNAMVLPVPLPQTLEFIDLSDYKNLFEDCNKCFYNNNRLRSNKVSNSYNTKDNKLLQVFNIGSYKVSVAMNLDQISRVDSKVFKLSPGLSKTLQTFYYQKYWGFIICKLNSGPELYHPIAYSHQIIDSKIYIPTRYYHQEVKWADINKWALGTHIDPRQNPFNTMNWNEDNIDMSPMFRMEKFGLTSPEANGWINKIDKINTSYKQESNSIAQISSRFDNLKKFNDTNYNQQKFSNSTDSIYKNIADDWSHSIYLVNLNFQLNEQLNNMNSCKEKWDQQTLFDYKKINFNFGYCNNFEKIKIEGSYPNIDIVIPINA